MTKRFHQSDSIRISLLESSCNAKVQIQQAWLPMAIWDGVRVEVKSRSGLTLMEQFVIECLLKLGSCGGDDLNEIAGLPTELAGWMLASLEQKGLARREQNDLFAPAIELCAEALACRSVITSREEQRTVLWFPETDEYVVLKEGSDFARMLRKTVPMGRYPLSERYKRVQRASLLSDALRLGRVYGEDCDSILAIVDHEILKEEMCPAYHVAAEMPSSGSRAMQLTLRGKKKRVHSPTGGGDFVPEDAPPEIVEHVFTLPVLGHLVNSWRTRLDHSIDEIGVQLKKLGLSSLDVSNGIYKASLDGKAAAQMACNRLLTDRAGLLLNLERDIEYQVPLELSPLDGFANHLFELDRVVREVLAAQNPSDAIKVLCGDDQTRRDALVMRMWQMKLYGPIYKLREREDFRT